MATMNEATQDVGDSTTHMHGATESCQFACANDLAEWVAFEVIEEAELREVELELRFLIGGIQGTNDAPPIAISLTSDYGAAYFIADTKGDVWFSSSPTRSVPAVAVRLEASDDPYRVVTACLSVLTGFTRTLGVARQN